MILWLRNNSEPMNVVLDKWAKTHSFRYNNLLNTEKELIYFSDYPAIKGPNGYQLVSIFFCFRNIDKVNKNNINYNKT